MIGVRALGLILAIIWVVLAASCRNAPQQPVPLTQMQLSIKSSLDYVNYTSTKCRTPEGDAEAAGYLRMIQGMDRVTFSRALSTLSAEDRETVNYLRQRRQQKSPG